MGYYNGANHYKIFVQNVGLERNYSDWFALRMEGNLQEITLVNKFYTFGTGFKLNARYSLPLKKKIKPYFEYGAGAFFSLKKFPKNGTSFTFNLNYAIGFSFQLKNQNKLSLD